MSGNKYLSGISTIPIMLPEPLFIELDWLFDKFAFKAKRTRRAEKYKVWMDSNHAVDLSNINIMQKIDYIHNNPVRAGLVNNPEEYVYSSARDYAGKKGLVEVTLV
ncbi:MAG: hypothetical protein ACK40G_04380 [Cytophagaceae bacterium]